MQQLKADYEKEKKPVYFISYHVDYWNKYGWKDPYSNIRFTRRQNNYVSATSSNEVYTPQVFVNGNDGFLGSDKKRLVADIEKSLKLSTKYALQLSLQSTLNDTLVINYTSSVADANVNIVLIVVENNITTKITKGENIGKTLVQDNVARLLEVYPVQVLKGELKLYNNKLLLNNKHQLIGYLQNKQSKKILAATTLNF